MTFLVFLLTAFLPFTVLANPVPDTSVASLKSLVVASSLAPSAIAARDADAETVGLFNRAALLKCDIIGVSTTVACRRYPRTTNSAVKKRVPGTQNNINFYCYTNCENIDGNTSWDWTSDWGGDEGCYISGHYTDDTCSRANLGECPWNECSA